VVGRQACCCKRHASCTFPFKNKNLSSQSAEKTMPFVGNERQKLQFAPQVIEIAILFQSPVGDSLASTDTGY
jgi:hypothetical protein